MLKACASEGMSTSQIANEISGALGIRVSRNAVIGKAMRARVALNAPNRPAYLPRTPNPSRPRQPRAFLVKSGSEPARQLAIKNRHIPPSEAFVILPGTSPRPMLETRLYDCRWPVDDPDRPNIRLSCCEPAIPGKSYCGAHHRLSVPKERSA